MSSSVNIDSKGYGKIYKAVMRNRDLPLIAKAIYSYFCSFAGNSDKAFPKRDKITRDMCVNKDTFTKHLATLVEKGYIAKERTPSGNIYTIVQSVPSYNIKMQEQPEDELTDMLVFENIKAKGFGTIPKLVMLDKRLTAQAKGIYAYFASFAGMGTTAFPRATTIIRELKLSKNTYYKHFNLLLEHGYITVEQGRSNGKYEVCIYRLMDTVDTPAGSQRARRAASEKVGNGTDGNVTGYSVGTGASCDEMSEKVSRGGKVLKTPPGMSEKVISDKPVSDKTVSQNFGHSNINNISTRNSYFITEQGYNHQRRPQRPQGVDDIPLFSLHDVKQKMNYDHLLSEAESWGELKQRACLFDCDEDAERYKTVIVEILEELAVQLLKKLNKADRPELVIAALGSEAFSMMFDNILAHWDEIYNVRGYVEASLKNLLK